jgi:hypothetical protein
MLWEPAKSKLQWTLTAADFICQLGWAVVSRYSVKYSPRHSCGFGWGLQLNWWALTTADCPAWGGWTSATLLKVWTEPKADYPSKREYLFLGSTRGLNSEPHCCLAGATWAMPSSAFSFSYFSDRVLCVFAQGQPQTSIILPIASRVSGTTGTYHHAWLVDWDVVSITVYMAGLKLNSSQSLPPE